MLTLPSAYVPLAAMSLTHLCAIIKRLVLYSVVEQDLQYDKSFQGSVPVQHCSARNFLCFVQHLLSNAAAVYTMLCTTKLWTVCSCPVMQCCWCCSSSQQEWGDSESQAGRQEPAGHPTAPAPDGVGVELLCGQ